VAFGNRRPGLSYLKKNGDKLIFYKKHLDFFMFLLYIA